MIHFFEFYSIPICPQVCVCPRRVNYVVNKSKQEILNSHLWDTKSYTGVVKSCVGDINCCVKILKSWVEVSKSYVGVKKS